MMNYVVSHTRVGATGVGQWNWNTWFYTTIIY